MSLLLELRTRQVSVLNAAVWHAYSCVRPRLPRVNSITRVRFEDPLSREVAQLLDGTQDLEAITQTVLESIRTGQAELRENKVVVTDPDRIAKLIKQQVREVLEALAKEGLLVG
jgi:hypothetical protein